VTVGKGRAVVSWSSGKDSAFALWEERRAGRFEVVGLLTTVTEAYGRVSMHGVREEILDRQAEATGLACRKVRIPAGCSNADYEQAMLQALRAELLDGVTHIVFGDLFLEDIRAYRERMLAGTGLAAVFPLWHRDTAALARQMLAAGLKATVVCVDPRKLPASFAGRAFDAAFLSDLPEGVDPCGENGEFHTCVTAGPMFGRTIRARPGDVVLREGFVFADLVPEEIAAAALR
jgi:uncharacterized protein (TIGR00290 family)